MCWSQRALVLALLLCGLASGDVWAGKKTVCTITINSADEKETFERNLPPDEYRFVELVQHGKPDWLASAGHFDGGTDFYSDRVDTRESLSVEELERASCSDSCPGLFSQLKEVYLFGCNTLNAAPLHTASGETTRSLVRSGHSPADAERLARALQDIHGESNRDRMRDIFKDVPAIYGFSSKAPLGASAGPVLERYFQTGGRAELASGRASPRLLGMFAAVSMTFASGVSESEPRFAHRRDVCQVADDRLSTAQKLDFVHRVLQREPGEIRMLLDRIEKYSETLGASERSGPAARVLDAISADRSARSRFLDFARDTDDPSVRVRMLELARSLNWLTPEEKRAELVRMIIAELNAHAADPAGVDRACALGQDRELSAAFRDVQPRVARADSVTNAAVMACMGRTESRARVLHALTSPVEEDVEIAQVYLTHRPIADAVELRHVALGISRMNGSSAQVRALDTLARQPLFDGDSLLELAQLFAMTKSIAVQRAIAGILIRADPGTIARAELIDTLKRHRMKSADGADVIDVLLRRLEAP
jgi:hypothetical protein